ncbi:PREDICTED: uncharacterized protein LOC106784148 isoform X1 [Polistes canadensis]|uniref:uncharacterized protein LOC106784148 isoform X1 n=1 Tax=Polistes canadensis TaxID=91411 RepID=UPI000718AE67|nr:PREDICTED: uncharacterized protein LOC106784148 isoform X1 [Polistes canadensis]
MISEKKQRLRICYKVGIIFLLIGSVISLEHTEIVPSNHRNVSALMSLMPEARNSEDQDMKNQTIRSSNIDLTTEEYSIPYTPNISKDLKKVKIPLKSTSSGNHYSSRIVKIVSKKDSYLEALEHSHTSKDPKEGVVHVDVKPVRSKLNRREYIQGPVYKPETEYGAPKEPSGIYNPPNGLGSSSKATKNLYSSPSSNNFFSKPTDSYSLPDQSSVNFQDYSAYLSDPQTTYGPPQTNYGPPQSAYGPPQSAYGPPQSAYGPPQSAYGPPQSAYGPPSNKYGVSAHPQLYDELSPGNSYLSHQQGEERGYDSSAMNYGTPYGYPSSSIIEFPKIDFSWPFALKLNAFTLAKILLKLVLFKMIVKFIAVICLLLFIPKLEIIKKPNKDESEEEEGRHYFGSNADLNLLTEMVMSSVEKYTALNKAKNDEVCTTTMCLLRRAFFYKESWKNYVELFKSYLLEEREKEIVESKRLSKR